MNKIENYGDTDIVWNKDVGKEPTTLIVFNQNEKGFASFITGMGLIGDEKPIARIFSKLHQVEPFNNFPEPVFPEWRLFEKYNDDGERFFILRVTHTFPVQHEDESSISWLYTYPIVRDIVMSLNERGVDALCYITVNLMQEFSTTIHGLIHENEIGVFDYMNHEESIKVWKPNTVESLDEDIVIPLPVWTFGSVFKNFCTNTIRENVTVIGGRDQNTFVNTETQRTLRNYIEDEYSLEFDREKEKYLTALLTDLEHLTKPLSLDRAMVEYGGDEFE
tara:strand:+ start:2402 stop:3232 length:831 start_codon:yes stop_codon:yes gene_type:complete